MKTVEIIRALQNKESTDNRELLDAAAERLIELELLATVDRGKIRSSNFQSLRALDFEDWVNIIHKNERMIDSFCKRCPNREKCNEMLEAEFDLSELCRDGIRKFLLAKPRGDIRKILNIEEGKA